MLCEFCGHGYPVALYPCPPLIQTVQSDAGKSPTFIPETNAESALDALMETNGGWMACETCGDMIDGHSIEALAQRAYTLGLSGGQKGLEQQSLDYYRALFLQFFEHRTGPGTPSRSKND